MTVMVHSRSVGCRGALVTISLFFRSLVHAQSNSPAGHSAGGHISSCLPVIVTAQKEPADPQTLPLSLTPVPKPTLQNAGVTIVSDAGAVRTERRLHRVHRTQAE